MNCIICFEKMKAECGGKVSNFSQRCITCNDSWVCGTCYNNWDITIYTGIVYKVMPCGICKKSMNYSHLVNRFNDGLGVGWWDDIKKEKPIWEYLKKMEEEEKEELKEAKLKKLKDKINSLEARLRELKERV